MRGHESDIILFEASAKALKGMKIDKLPSAEKMKAERDTLTSLPPRGICINEDCETVIDKYLIPNYSQKVQLILKLPPFPLKRAKNTVTK